MKAEQYVSIFRMTEKSVTYEAAFRWLVNTLTGEMQVKLAKRDNKNSKKLIRHLFAQQEMKWAAIVRQLNDSRLNGSTLSKALQLLLAQDDQARRQALATQPVPHGSVEVLEGDPSAEAQP